MRIIAGEFRSRKLKTLPGLDTRPTPDRLRESLFSILMPRLEGSVFLDAYAGTGAVGLEALSRGAARAIFIERSKAAAQVLRDNLTTLGLLDRAKLIQGAVTTYLAAQQADIVFLDPPYALDDEYSRSLEILASQPPPLLLVQHATRYRLPVPFPPFRETRVLKQGDNAITFLQPEAPAHPHDLAP